MSLTDGFLIGLQRGPNTNTLCLRHGWRISNVTTTRYGQISNGTTTQSDGFLMGLQHGPNVNTLGLRRG